MSLVSGKCLESEIANQVPCISEVWKDSWWTHPTPQEISLLPSDFKLPENKEFIQKSFLHLQCILGGMIHLIHQLLLVLNLTPTHCCSHSSLTCWFLKNYDKDSLSVSFLFLSCPFLLCRSLLEKKPSLYKNSLLLCACIQVAKYGRRTPEQPRSHLKYMTLNL